MHYVVAHDHYYPVGGFNDIKFKGSYEDCLLVKEELSKRHDYVCITEDHVNTTLSDWI
jgi:hypothetical protein